MPEFVVVRFTRQRPVFMDDQPMGVTGKRVTVQAGFHVFDLGRPPDYQPPRQTVHVVGTGPDTPMHVDFSTLDVSSAVRRTKRGRAAATTKAARKAVASKRKKAAVRKKAARRPTTRRRPKAASRKK